MAPIPRNNYRNESTRARMRKQARGYNRPIKVSKKLIAQIARATQETKTRLFVEQSKTYSYNTIASWNLTYDIAQGVTSNERIGQKIHLVGLKLRYEIGTTANQAQASFRVMVLMSTSQVATSGNLTTSDLFVANTTNNIQAISDARKIVKLYDETQDVIQQTTGNAVGHFTEKYIAINRDFNYLLDGNSRFGEEMNLYVVVIPHTQTGSFGGNNVYCQWNGKLYFKDA